MKLIFHPQRSDAALELSRVGDVLTINGEDFDFSGVSEGATLPKAAVASAWIAGDIERTGGVLSVPIVLPHGPRAPQGTRFAQPLTLTGDGPVVLPAYNEE